MIALKTNNEKINGNKKVILVHRQPHLLSLSDKVGMVEVEELPEKPEGNYVLTLTEDNKPEWVEK